MQSWNITGILATLIIVISLPLYALKDRDRLAAPEDIHSATFVTSKACAKCHKKEYEEWQDSHHAKAMSVANDETVLGNFDDAVFDIVMISFAIHEKDRGTQEKLVEEVHRLIKEGGVVLVVDFSFDERTTKLGKMGIDFIERMAGGEHYLNFKEYTANGGLGSLIKTNKFMLIKDSRRAFNGVTISTYRKI